MQVDAQVGFDAIISSGEKLIGLVNSLDMSGLEKKIPEYTQQVAQYFLGLDKEKLSSTDITSLEQLMVNHRNLVTLISQNKKKVSTNIKQLHIGKKMQNTYPKKAL